ncbi:DNA replication complex GINS protein PSF1 [Coelomomyces lativittatus]|nr:DNA replication complex GINS protein PSF1 [Coelomomyces lativittatus]KAJ1513001.1 DNA replication complex GINS protein PSF1 [Coelomomyces lativittatus]KAJ1513403.1 DNA replication complex GINS protein PSF1 [Coelomomyces lativittatus]
MYGDEVLVLIREAQRIKEGLFPVYNESLVRNVIKELLVLVQEQNHLLHTSSEKNHPDTLESTQFKAAFLIHHACIERNKRCLLAYLLHRWQKIQSMIWELGHLPSELMVRLSPLEAKTCHAYADLLLEYKSTYSSLDLTSAMVPPKELFICVRVLKECGDIVTENGSTLVLQPNAQHFLRRTDVERLITQGYLEHLSN